MLTIELSGVLGRMFGKSYTLNVSSPAEAVRALCTMLDGFEKYVRENEFHIWLDERNVDADELKYASGKTKVFKLAVVVTGAGGNNGIWMTVAGVVLLIVAWWNPASWGAAAQMMVAGLGAGLAAAGVAMMMMPTAKGDLDEDGNRASYGFNGAVTTISHGNIVPVAYGECFQGGFVLTWQLEASETRYADAVPKTPTETPPHQPHNPFI